jgi:hypothetical protein
LVLLDDALVRVAHALELHLRRFGVQRHLVVADNRRISLSSELW